MHIHMRLHRLRLNAQIGNVTSKLREKQMYDNTLIIVSSDNGGAFCTSQRMGSCPGGGDWGRSAATRNGG